MGLSNQIKKYIAKIKWRKKNKHNQTRLGKISMFDCVSIGKGTYGPIYVEMSKQDIKLFIGNYCSIGENVTFILSSDHPSSLLSTYPFRSRLQGINKDAISKGNIVVDDDVWIGYGATILSGVHIGQGAIIAAGAVVTEDLPPYAIVGGVPAKLIKYRFGQKIIDKLMNVDFSKISDEFIVSHMDFFYDEITDESDFSWLPKKKIY